jgi:nucleotide-binding universal stress UspA family protein
MTGPMSTAERSRRRSSNDLEAAVTKLREHGVDTEDALMPTGEPKQIIERIADRGHFDTIVVGHRALKPIQRVLDRSVAGHVATHAHADVVVVH